MKQLIFVTLLFVSSYSFADQLAYITKEQAEESAAKLKQSGAFWSFCGCCDDKSIEFIEIKTVFAEYTGQEDFYQVVVEYLDKNGKLQRMELDLAYVWIKKGKRYKTLGTIMGYKHESCENLASYLWHYQ